MKDVFGRKIKEGDIVLAVFFKKHNKFDAFIRKAEVVTICDDYIFIRRKKKDREVEYGCDKRECKRRIVVIESKEE